MRPMPVHADADRANVRAVTVQAHADLESIRNYRANRRPSIERQPRAGLKFHRWR